MADHVSKKKRSQIMAAIKGKDTQPEHSVRRILHAAGFRYRLHVKDLPGKPDICLPKYKTVIFVHGCFWHRHKNCKRASFPSSNRKFWEKKFSDTEIRDAKAISKLEGLGWRVLVVWQCQIADPKKIEKELLAAILSKH